MTSLRRTQKFQTHALRAALNFQPFGGTTHNRFNIHFVAPWKSNG